MRKEEHRFAVYMYSCQCAQPMSKTNILNLWLFRLSRFTWSTSDSTKENKSDPSPHQPHIHLLQLFSGKLQPTWQLSKSSSNKFHKFGVSNLKVTTKFCRCPRIVCHTGTCIIIIPIMLIISNLKDLRMTRTSVRVNIEAMVGNCRG